MDSRKKVRLTDLGAHKICRQVKQRMSNKSNGYLMMATLAPLSTATSTPTVNWPPSGAAGAIKFKQKEERPFTVCSALRQSHLGLVKINSSKQIKQKVEVKRKELKNYDALVTKWVNSTTTTITVE